MDASTPPLMASGNAATGLAALEARLAQDLSWLEWPVKRWVAPRLHQGQAMLEVAVVGGGMAGLTAAAALRLAGIEAVVFDRAPTGFEGPWATTARMETLRSPKHLTGPALGLPALTFRAWYEAQFGVAAWQALDKIPRLQWMDYLRWYRQVLGLDVRNEHAVERVSPCADGRVELAVRHAGGLQWVQARRVVLATGRDGLGSPHLPDWAQQVPADRRAHSADDLDHTRLKGARVAVIGGSAAAMDSAATALEAGAGKVELLIRREKLPLINKSKGAGHPGFLHGYLDLPDDWKWRIRRYFSRVQTPPPRGSTLRVSRHPNAFFNLGCPVEQVVVGAQGIELRTPRGVFEVDFVIFATGFRVNFAARPEFAEFASQLRLWGERWTPEAGDEDEELSQLPDLGADFAFRAREPERCPGLERIHCFCYPAILTHGAVSGDIPAISEGAQRLSRAIASALFRESVDAHVQAMQDYADPELLGDEWRNAQPPHERP